MINAMLLLEFATTPLGVDIIAVQIIRIAANGRAHAVGHGGYEHKTVKVTLGTRPNSVPNANTPEG